MRALLVDEREHPGPAHQRYLAAAGARADTLASLDTDCAAQEGWIQRLVDVHAKRRRVIGGSVRCGTPGNVVDTAECIAEFYEYRGLPCVATRCVRLYARISPSAIGWASWAS